jgi:hypothetical protein
MYYSEDEETKNGRRREINFKVRRIKVDIYRLQILAEEPREKGPR